MKIQVRGLALVSGALTRKSIVEIVDEYASRHVRVKKLARLRISFVPIIMHEGMKRGGLQYGDEITISTRSLRNRRLDMYELVQTLYHELYHLSENGMANGRVGCKGPMPGYEPSEWREEIAAILSSNTELDSWSGRICRKYSFIELKAIAPFVKDWPDT